MLRLLAPALALGIVLGSSTAAADDDLRFRRTTPRASLGLTGDGVSLGLGVPSGRAWGLESQLIRVGPAGASVWLELTVDDEAVREAFVRVAWYERDEGRPRQMAIVDSPFVMSGDSRTIRVRLEPPAGAVAYRVRVLARVHRGLAGSDTEAIVIGPGRIDAARPSATQLRGPP